MVTHTYKYTYEMVWLCRWRPVCCVYMHPPTRVQYMSETDVHVRETSTGEKGRERCKVFQTKGKAAQYKEFENCWH